MENKTSFRQVDDQELVVLLRTLRVEATPEAHFEERFLYDFRERLVREAVCRPARTLLWENFLQYLRNFGRRRLAWGASSFGLGVLCLGALTWLHGGNSARMAGGSYKVPMGAQSLMPEEAQAESAVHTTVRRRSNRRAYTETLADIRSVDDSSYYLAGGGEDDMERLPYFSDGSVMGGLDAASSSMPDMMLHVAH